VEFKEIALRMWPYWALGLFMLGATAKSSFKELIRVDKKAVLKWSAFLLVLVLYRLLTFKLYMKLDFVKTAVSGMSTIPWLATTTVFWEDACHGLPLVLLKKLTENKWYSKFLTVPAFILVMTSFGSGHIYQGWLAALMLMYYIPMSMKLGEKYGFGTVMIGHTLYDLSTLLAVRYATGGF
jgi:hypothetical protein